jgi:hypothetical protein
MINIRLSDIIEPGVEAVIKEDGQETKESQSIQVFKIGTSLHVLHISAAVYGIAAQQSYIRMRGIFCR